MSLRNCSDPLGPMRSSVPIPTPTVIAHFLVGGHRSARHVPPECCERSSEHALYRITVESGDDACPTHVGAEVRLPADEAWCLNAARALASVHGEVRPPWPVGCFAVLRQGKTFFQVSFSPNAHFRLRRDRNNLIARFVLRDRKRCGLRLWGEHKLHPSPGRNAFGIMICRLDQPDDAVWVEPFPRAARSVVCLTDHPDWDSVAKVTALGELFERHDIRITKGVFPVADAGFSRYGPGLNVPEYAALIDRWSEAGHEIAFHGIGSCGEITGLDADECIRRIDRLFRYRPETWIDHGSGQYAFARAGRLPGGLDLLAVLCDRGIRNFWSFGDAWQNPADHLDIWHRRSVAGSFADFARLARRRGTTRPKELAYLGTIPLKNMAGIAQYLRLLRRPWSVAEWKAVARNYRLLREINTDPFYLYDLGGNFALQNPDGTWVFDTILLNHLALQLCPSSIDRLVECGGILIAHVYLGAVHAYGGRNCFHVRSEAEFLPAFREDMEHIGELQKRADLITLPFRDLRRALVGHARSRVVRCEGRWQIMCDAVVCSRRPFRIDGRAATPNREGVFSANVHGTTILQHAK